MSFFVLKAKLNEKDDEIQVLQTKIEALQITFAKDTGMKEHSSRDELNELRVLFKKREDELTIAKQAYDKLKDKAKQLLSSNKQLKVSKPP